MTWFIFEGILCTDLGINEHEWAQAQQIATIVPSGTLYKIDKAATVLQRIQDAKKERILKALGETLVTEYPIINRITLSRMYYSYHTRKIMALLEVDTPKEGLSGVLYVNEGNNEFKYKLMNLTYKYEQEYKGKPIVSIYNLPNVIDIRPALLEKKES